MRKLLLAKSLALKALLLLSTAAFAQNLVTNGDFESRNQAPQGKYNIAPPNPYDDLQNWYRTPTSTTTNPPTNYPDYVANDGAPAVNPATYFPSNVNYSFYPRTGESCVVLYQHNFNGDHRYNSIITQQLGTVLTAGHTYQVEYWVRRLASDQYRTQLGLYITNSAPTFDAAYDVFTNTYSYNFSPAPGNKVLLSGDVQDTQNWTRISGTIIPNDNGNQWLTIGYASTGQRYDASVPGYSVAGIYYAIDDISLVDLTVACATAPGPIGGYYNYNVGSLDVSIDPVAGASYYNWYRDGQLSKGHGNFNTWWGQRNVCGSTTVTVEAVFPSCITPRASRTFQGPPGCSGGGGPELGRSANTAAYPNPATESLTIPEGAESATLLNSEGKPVQSANEAGRLNIQALPDGLYNLQMMQNGKLINQRIQVKH